MPERRILLVDDSPTTRRLIVLALGRLNGVRTTEATDGVDALKKLTAERYDLLITDINMPIMDGLKLVSLVRGETRRDLRVVVISTEGAVEDRHRAFSLGVDEYLMKPLQIHRVVDTVARLLGLNGEGA